MKRKLSLLLCRRAVYQPCGLHQHHAAQRIPFCSAL